MRKLALIAVAVVAAAAGLFYLLTIPATVSAAALPPYKANLANGRTMFDIGGCASCHATPNADPDKVDRSRLGGGLALVSPFGTFYVPNISPDRRDGIGAWSEADFVSALWDGTARGGYHLYPAFPYTSYRHMRLSDLRDLFAYLRTLPPVAGRVRRHDLRFPFDIRRLVGLWNLLFLRGGPFVAAAGKSAQWNRGAYLVNAPGHCAQCHSPRNFVGAIIASERFAGGQSADGKGFVPNITRAGLKDWSPSDIASFLADGMTPSGDFAGGAMTEVIRNTALLGTADRAAIAAYIASLPPRIGPKPPPR